MTVEELSNRERNEGRGEKLGRSDGSEGSEDGGSGEEHLRIGRG